MTEPLSTDVAGKTDSRVKHADPRDWIAASEAVRRLERVMKSAAAAKERIIQALASGELTATAASIREEWAIGTIRAKPARDGHYVILEMKESTLARISIPKDHFVRQPKGARLWSRWPASQFAWISPQGRASYRKSTQEYRHVASKRFVMLDVVFSRRQFDPIIEAQRTSLKRTISARGTALVKSYTSRKSWEVEKLAVFYDMANAGKLEEDYPLESHGAKKQFAKKLMAHCNEDISNKTRLRTYLRQVERLKNLNRTRSIELGEAASSIKED